MSPIWIPPRSQKKAACVGRIPSKRAAAPLSMKHRLVVLVPRRRDDAAGDRARVGNPVFSEPARARAGMRRMSAPFCSFAGFLFFFRSPRVALQYSCDGPKLNGLLDKSGRKEVRRALHRIPTLLPFQRANALSYSCGATKATKKVGNAYITASGRALM